MSAGFIFGNHSHFPDHLAPLCSLFNIPLILTEDLIISSSKKYYPELKVIEYKDYCSVFKFLTENFSTIFSCHLILTDGRLRTLFEKFFKNLYSIWLTHGHSDKMWENNALEALSFEKMVLIYGKKMLDAMKKQGVSDKIPYKIILGNYRYHYYNKHKDFYKEIMNKEIKDKLSKDNKTILYAPTWGITPTALQVIPELLKNKEYNIIIKPHQNSLDILGIELKRMLWDCEDRENIIVLNNFPPIYPLLDFCDIYLGNTSSIGYDFLTFQKPMFFLNPKKTDIKNKKQLFIYKTGDIINHPKDIFSVIKNSSKNYSTAQKNIYDYTFDKTPDYKKLFSTILSLRNLKKEG